MSLRILAAEPQTEGLFVAWSDGSRERYPWLWLRDHAIDAESYDARTSQRELFTATVDPEIRAARVDLCQEGAAVDVAWPDSAAPARYPAELLARFRLDRPTPAEAPGARPWDAAGIAGAAASLPFAPIERDDAALRGLLEALESEGFAVLTECPRERDSVRRIAERIGYVRETIFGGLWEFEANEGMADTAYTPKALRPHTDATYSHDAPGLQMLLCLDYRAEGGESILVDGLAIAERLRRDSPEDFATLCRIVVPGRYLGDGAHLEARRPVFRLDHCGRVVQVSFNNYDRAPFRLPDAEMAAFYRALRAFEELANDPAVQWRHVLAPGELLVFDNWRVLHGRAAFRGQRRMAGCYVNREDVESRLRGLRGD